MATIEKSEGLVLRRFPHGDSSLIAHVFTRSHGRVHFMAKGARAGGKRTPTPLIPVALLELIWKPSTKSELQLLREVSLEDGYGLIHQDLERLAWAQAALETLARTLTGQEPHEGLFTVTLGYLKALTAPKPAFEKLFYRFQLRVLKELGYALDLSTPEGDSPQLLFIANKGKAIPIGRQEVTSLKHTGQAPIRAGHWKTLQVLDGNDPDSYARLIVPPDAQREIERVLHTAFEQAFDRWKPLESLRLIRGGSKVNST